MLMLVGRKQSYGARAALTPIGSAERFMLRIMSGVPFPSIVM